MADVQDPRRLSHPLDGAPQLHEGERILVKHRAVADAVEHHALRAEALVERVPLALEEPLRGPAVQPEPRLVHRLPHLDAHHLPDRPGILPNGTGGAVEGEGMAVVPDQIALDHLRILDAIHADPLEEVPFLADYHDQGPPAFRAVHAHVQAEARGHLEQPRPGIDPLEVAGEPEAGVGHARDHRLFPTTQVSLDPPPWLELTT